ncbi:MAG: pseudouridine synthase [Gammaproteobacteria bacterium]|nr:pseudouridine synthase [Gammaproteobacteria bacterium]
MKKIIAFNKPFNVLCQFTDPSQRPTLADYIKNPGYYAAGRLDKDSEGLLLLTNDGRIQDQITHPRFKVWKTYWVQVEGDITSAAVAKLTEGVALKEGMSKPAKVEVIAEPKALWSRNPPIRYRATIATNWLSLAIREGRNRQIRRMTAAVGLPTLRLIRYSIGDVSLDDLQPGQWRFEKDD